MASENPFVGVVKACSRRIYAAVQITAILVGGALRWSEATTQRHCVRGVTAIRSFDPRQNVFVMSDHCGSVIISSS